MNWKGVIVFFLGAVAGFLLSQAAQALLDAGAASKMKHSIGNAMTLSAALEKFREDHGRYPPTVTGDRLVRALTPKYVHEVPTDVYGRPFVITLGGSAPTIVSVGRGGFVVQQQKLVECRPYTTEGCR